MNRLPFLLLLMAIAAPARAMNDPTLPPPALRAVAASGAITAAAAPATPRLRLQGLKPGQSALIDGRLRRPGERWQGYELLRVDARLAWLRDPEGRLLRLTLLPTPTPENRP